MFQRRRTDTCRDGMTGQDIPGNIPYIVGTTDQIAATAETFLLHPMVTLVIDELH